MKRVYALGDDQMAEANDRQEKERSNMVVRMERRRVERGVEGGGGGSVLHGESSLGESE